MWWQIKVFILSVVFHFLAGRLKEQKEHIIFDLIIIITFFTGIVSLVWTVIKL